MGGGDPLSGAMHALGRLFGGDEGKREGGFGGWLGGEIQGDAGRYREGGFGGEGGSAREVELGRGAVAV